MKYTFVGDIHGKIEQIQRALDNEGLVVFVGDFMDSFDRSVKEHEECLKTVLKAIDDGKAQAILGNHELSYIHKHHKCSGHSFERGVMFLKYKWEILEKFSWFLQIEDWFISHAGLHPEVQAEIKHPTYLEWAQDWNSSAHWIGHFRGGLRRVGGIFWCDFNKEFEPIYGINQIFGHTAGKDIRKVEIPGSINYCIDCLNHKHSFLQLEI
jgi:hypothetical protein